MKRRFLGALSLIALLPALAWAHHILGIPHYAYDESYPQAPVITYSVLAGPYEVSVTGYPGRPAPFERAEIHAYVRRPDDESDVFAGSIQASVLREGLLGLDAVWGPVPTRFEDNLHVATPQFGDAGRYRVRLEMQLEGQPYQIDFPLAVGEPGDPRLALLAWGGTGLLFLVVLRAVRIKLDRRRGRAVSARGAPARSRGMG